MTTAEYQQIRAELQADEGLRLSAYRDTAGKLTIGYGRLIEAPGGISKSEAELLLDNDLARALSGVRQAFPWAVQTLNAVRYRVLVEMVFQLGLHGVQRFTRFLAFAEDGQYDKAAEEMLDSLAAAQTPKRWQRLARMMQLGKDIE